MLLFNNSTVGGAERRYAWVYQELRRRRIPIVLAINESLLMRLRRLGVITGAEAPDFVLKEPLGQKSFLLRKIDYLLGLLPLSLWIWRRRPQILHLVLGGAYLALPSQLFGTAPPAVLSVVCPSLRDMVGSKTGLWLYRLALRRAERVDALTESVQRMVREEGVAAERISMPSGSCVDTQRFRPATKQPWVVFSGRLIPEKDPLLFVQACMLVRERMRDRTLGLRMFLLGDGPLRADAEALIEKQGLGPWMTVGWNDEVESVLNGASVFVSVQRTDNYPSQSLLEAMASGAAIVATDIGLTRKLVDDQVGRLVSATPIAVAEAIIDLLANPAQTVAMGVRARERVARQHSLERYLDYIQNVYAMVG
jgi:glycosyltransferase involved in cell wall biosynthesis